MQAHTEILKHLDFGSDVAENDIGLTDYFIETTDFSTIISGKVDLIRGHKGIGKSAIYKTLLCGKYTPPDTIIVSASDATSSEIFRATQTEANTEDQIRLLWTAYLSSIIANNVCSQITESSENRDQLKQIKEFLKTFNLSKDKSSGSLLDTIRRTKSFGFGLGTSLDGAPSLNFNVDFDQQQNRIPVSEQDFLDLINLCVDVLRNAKKTMWVLIDRLDELFKKNSSNEILSLRALLRSHLKICAIKQGQMEVRSKIFIRTDIYDNITRKEGFTNITHLRDLNIRWSIKSILALVCKRVVTNNEVVRKLNEFKVNHTDPSGVWNILVPQKIQAEPSEAWLARATGDSSSAFNPRNYITLLSLALKKDIELLRTNPFGVTRDSVLSVESITSSYGELSRKRLDDTILAEFPDVRPYIDKLRGGYASFQSLEQLGDALGILNNATELEQVVKRLIEIGILQQITSSTFSIAFLYRPALKVGKNPREALTGQER